MRFCIGIAVAAMVALHGCNRGAVEADVAPADIARNHVGELEAFANMPNREEALGRICAAIAQEEGMSEDEVLEGIMHGHPDEEIAAYIFSQEATRIVEDGAAIDYCRSVSTKFPGTCLGAAAVDGLLARLRNGGSAQFEKEAVAIAGGSNAREKFVALYRLAEFRRGTGPSVEAARVFLELTAYDGERVAETGALNSVIMALMDAGMLVEADCLEATPFRGRCAAVFLAEDGEGGTSGAFSAAMAECRRGRRALEALDAESTMGAYSRFAGLVRELLRGGAVGGEHALCLHACCFASAKRLNDMFGGDYIFFRGARRNKLPSAGKAEDISGLLCELSIECLDAFGGDAAIEDHDYRKVVEDHVALLKQLNHRERVVAVYSGFLAKYADSPFAPPLMLELGDYCRDGCKTPAQARDIYGALHAAYPATPESGVARLKQALCMYELGAYEDAYGLLQIVVAENDPYSDIPSAEFLLGLTEAAMGLDDDAAARLMEVAAMFPGHECASKALFWVANNRLGRQEYEEARDFFNEVVERYPQSPYAMKARDYVKRLESAETRAAQ